MQVHIAVLLKEASATLFVSDYASRMTTLHAKGIRIRGMPEVIVVRAVN